MFGKLLMGSVRKIEMGNLKCLNTLTGKILKFRERPEKEPFGMWKYNVKLWGARGAVSLKAVCRVF